MLRAVPMSFFQCLAPARYLRSLTEILGQTGALHLVAFPGVQRPELLSKEKACNRLLHTVEETKKLLDPRILEVPSSVRSGEIQVLEEQVNEVAQKARTLTDALNEVFSQQEAVSKDIQMLEPLSLLPWAVGEEQEKHSFLTLRTGHLPLESVQQVQDEMGERALLIPFTNEKGENRILAVSSRKGRWKLKASLEKKGFIEEDFASLPSGVPQQTIQTLRGQLDLLKARQKTLFSQKKQLSQENTDLLREARDVAQTELGLVKASLQFGGTQSSCAFQGWIPSEEVSSLKKAIAPISPVVVKVYENPEEILPGVAPPVLMKSPRWLRPFQKLVSLLGSPTYDEIHPVPFFAFSYILFFGLMFGDVGHGTVLLITSFLLKRFQKDRDFSEAAILLRWLSVSSIFFGFLYGSVMGIETWIPALWVHPMEDAVTVMAAGVGLGCFLMLIGVALNLTNKLLAKDLEGFLFDRFGLLATWIYLGAIALVGLMAWRPGWKESQGPLLLAAGLLVVLPLTLLLFSGPLRWLVWSHHRKEESLVEALIDGIVLSLEAINGFVVNSISFIRLGAFALSHAILSYCVTEIVQTMDLVPGGILLKPIVFVGGNVMIILMEGLVVCIQALRLEYYEFFSKFYVGGGEPYHPFSIGTIRKTP